jgi:tetratricopeptide (TPR) repeat protein
MVIKKRPNEPPRLLAAIERRQGDWDNSVQHWEKAFDLDPRRPRLALEIGTTFMSMRNYKKAEFWYHRNNILVPSDRISKGRLAKCYLLDDGNIKATLSTLKTINNFDSQNRSALESILLIGLFTKDYNLILNHLDSINTVFINDQMDFMDKYSAYAYIYYVKGDTHKVNQYADSSLMVLTDLLETKQDDPRYHSAAGLAYAFKGQKNAALTSANHAIDIFPISLDALDGPLYVYNLAWVYTIIGEYDKAIDKLEYLLSIPAGMIISKAKLKINPKWHNLRNHPRFQKLIK